MREKSFIQRFLIVGTLLTFLALSFVSAMPHTHPGMEGPKPHDCFLCRAHSVQPFVEESPFLESSPLFVVGVTAPLFRQFIAPSFKNVPLSRAPPLSV